MATIVLNDEDADHEPRGRRRQQENNPVRLRQAQIHACPKREEWNKCVRDLPEAAIESRRPIWRDGRPELVRIHLARIES